MTYYSVYRKGRCSTYYVSYVLALNEWVCDPLHYFNYENHLNDSFMMVPPTSYDID